MVSRDKLEIPLPPQVWRIPCRLLNPVWGHSPNCELPYPSYIFPPPARTIGSDFSLTRPSNGVPGSRLKRWRIAGSVRTEDYPTKSPRCYGRMEVRWNSCWLYQNIGWRFLELPEVKVRATSSLLRVLDIEHSRSRSKEKSTSPSAKLLAIGCKTRLMESASGSLSSVIYWT